MLKPKNGCRWSPSGLVQRPSLWQACSTCSWRCERVLPGDLRVLRQWGASAMNVELIELGVGLGGAAEAVFSLRAIAGAVVDQARVIEQVRVAGVGGQRLVHLFSRWFELPRLVKRPGHRIMGIDAVP